MQKECDLNSRTRSFIVEMHWTLLHEWAQNAGLDVIACIAPQSLGNESQSHSKVPANLEKFISFSDDMDYNISLQLGYGKKYTKCIFLNNNRELRLQNAF